MGILAPLYLAGLAALSLPLVLHLVRRTPRGQQLFSSLMFLAPSPPRLTRRSRLDQILLLLLRLAALALLAMAFARPFLRESAILSLSDLPRRRVAILVDVSASMRRGDLLQRAVQQVERELNQLAPQDDVALFSFSDHLETVAGFADDRGVSNESALEVVRQQARSLRPTWRASNLGVALTTLAGELDAASDVQQSLVEPQIVVVSDFQKGSRTDALQTHEWPKRVRVVTRELAVKPTTNAHVQLLTSQEDAPDAEPRVRVANAADSTADQFFVRWATDKQTSSDGETAVYVPPGQSRVVRLRRLESNLFADRIVLRGDDHDFDNTFYVVPPRKQEVSLLYAGADAADDPQGLQYYLRLATASDPLRQVGVQVLDGDGPISSGEQPSPGTPQIVVVARSISSSLAALLKTFVEQGGTLVLVPKDRQGTETLPLFFDDVGLGDSPARPRADDFSLLAEIDFAHPLFAPFANPRYSDFTKIHFWQHRPVSLKKPTVTHVVARLDNGDPWMLERTVGRGRVLALTAGWQPDDSQLAVSSKFVPLISSLLDLACGTAQPLAGVTVAEPVSLSATRNSPLPVHMPDGREVTVAAGAASFDQTDLPGIYRAGAGSDELRFAVNVAAAESDTAPMELEQLEQLGVRMGADLTPAERLSRIRQQRDVELESRQKVWRWLLVACLGLLTVETWWAGRAARPRTRLLEAAV